MIRYHGQCNKRARLNSSMKLFSKIIEDLKLKDLSLVQGPLNLEVV